MAQFSFPVTHFAHPRLTIPPPLMMSQAGSFAYFTMTERWPAIARRILAETPFPSEIVANVEALIQELFSGTIRHLQDHQAPDLAVWSSHLEPLVGMRWWDIPWFFAEVYFYRRLLEATYYFQSGEWQGIDPFASQKQANLATALEAIRTTSGQLNEWAEAHQQEDWSLENLRSLLYSALWGNQADLSLRPNDLPTQQRQQAEQQTQILVDDTPVLGDRLTQIRGGRIDLVADNAGTELIGDLYLIDFLLSSQIAQTVHLHVKAHPTFVSDATSADVQQTVKALMGKALMGKALMGAGDRQVHILAQRLQQYLDRQQLQLREDSFWTEPLVFWQMPLALQQDLYQSELVLIKGDANYRRLLGDCQWPLTTSFQEITGYFPTPFCVLRTLKSEVAAGLLPKQIQSLNQTDPQWLTNGEWGVIQAAKPWPKT